MKNAFDVEGLRAEVSREGFGFYGALVPEIRGTWSPLKIPPGADYQARLVLCGVLALPGGAGRRHVANLIRFRCARLQAHSVDTLLGHHLRLNLLSICPDISMLLPTRGRHVNRCQQRRKYVWHLHVSIERRGPLSKCASCGTHRRC